MSVLAFVEQRGGVVRGTAFEVLTVARGLADELDGDLVAVLLGPASLSDDAEDLGRYGADRVLFGGADELSEYIPEVYTGVVAREAEGCGAKAVVFAATALGKDLAPRVAARLQAGLASDVTEVEVRDGRVTVVRPAYAGKVLMRLAMKAEPALISVRPRTVVAEERPTEAEVETVSVDLSDVERRTSVESVADEGRDRPDVAEAAIVVSGGRGMGGPENWHLLEDLADALGSSAGLGASRAVVDAGWRPHSEQVGQTGKVVSPPLYFAIGISGAIQHQAGMDTAKCIVAVNKDAEAPIFKLADYGIVGDLFEIVPRLTEEIRTLRSEE